jgi:hypothetical protein
VGTAVFLGRHSRQGPAAEGCQALILMGDWCVSAWKQHDERKKQARCQEPTSLKMTKNFVRGYCTLLHGVG